MKIEDPFHAGEIKAQHLAGEAAIAEGNSAVIADSIIAGALPFLKQQKMVAIGTKAEDGSLWASPLLGLPGFVSPADDRTVRFHRAQIRMSNADIFWRNLYSGARAGMLAIELSTRRRLRVNGTLDNQFFEAHMIQRLFILFPLFLFIATAQKFFPDDPLERDLKPLWVKEAANRKLSDYYDLLRHTFGTPGELNRSLARPNPAQGVNTLGEPLQGAWWVKRHYYKAMSPHAMVDGPGTERPPSMGGPWTVVGAKNEGVTPGFLMYDQQKRLYFIKFDPSTNPEMATAADHVANRLLYALGYHVPENYLVEFTSEQLVLGKDVKIADRLGRRRRMTQRDLNEMLLKVHKTGRGLFRATASLAIVGSGIGQGQNPGEFHKP
jgi:predicted pyridoxine 5'-phosphate oxidase superfamily flavin-nucleotide-binding protein